MAVGYMKLGLRQKDAAHVACAEYSKADYFLTTDKKILNKRVTAVVLMNPIDFIRRFLDDQ
jgi:predicted nucleic acid-binding protein